MGHFNDYQKKISAMLDPGETADSGMYAGEVDFDFSKVGPALHEKLERLVAEYSWTRQGPLETE